MRDFLGRDAASLTDEQKQVLAENRDLLVVGRPGTGKTTVALLKAIKVLREHREDSANILFLSFSKAAVQRIQAASRLEVRATEARRLHLATFHSFCFGVLASHAPLLGLHHLRGVVTPHEERMIKSEMGATNEGALEEELRRIEREEGRMAFDRMLFLTVKLFREHSVIQAAYARAYPLVIVDEYQDTSDLQDGLLTLLGRPGQIIYLGDPDQRVYGYLPDVRADRFDRLQALGQVTRIDLPNKCHRSGTSDLVDYGRAVLAGTLLSARPKDVSELHFGNAENFRHWLRVAMLNAETAAKKKLRLPSATRPRIAVLAYTNKFVSYMSMALRTPTSKFPVPFAHRIHASVEELGAAWSFALSLLQLDPATSVSEGLANVLDELGRVERAELEAVHKKRGAQLLATAQSLRHGTKVAARSLKDLSVRVDALRKSFCGDPWKDISATIALLRGTGGQFFRDVVDVLDLRPLSDALTLMRDLATKFAEQGFYSNAKSMGEAYLLREHLLEPAGMMAGRVLMTLHKSKGKEFDAVVIVSGFQDNDGLVLRSEMDAALKEESRKLLSMAIARARAHVVILTPVYKPCPLLPRIG